MWEERLSEFVTLFIVINPFGVLPAFLATTGGVAGHAQRRIAATAVLVSFVVLLFFIVAGGFVLEKMGVSLRSFQIGGGIILFLIALEMVRGESHAPAESEPASGHHHGLTALAIYPLAIPKIAGPAAMLAVVLLTDDHRFQFGELAMTTGVLAVVLVITLGVLLTAGPISRLIGVSGASVISRVLGMILVALAVQTILTGFGDWLGLPKL
jgi:multiple antibiotic resistance protein